MPKYQASPDKESQDFKRPSQKTGLSNFNQQQLQYYTLDQTQQQAVQQSLILTGLEGLKMNNAKSLEKTLAAAAYNSNSTMNQNIDASGPGLVHSRTVIGVVGGL